MFCLLYPCTWKLRSKYRKQTNIKIQLFFHSFILLGQLQCKRQEIYFHLFLALISSMIFLLTLFPYLLLFHLQVFSSTFILKGKSTWFSFNILKSCGVNKTDLLSPVILWIFILSMAKLRYMSFFKS